VGALLAAAVVVLGAWVRLTDAGLGCPGLARVLRAYYPQAGLSDPQRGFQFGKALHEMVHRYFAWDLGCDHHDTADLGGCDSALTATSR